MKTDTLDQTTDAELSTLFAIECAEAKEGDGVPTWADGNGRFRESDWPSFAASADAVLPFLEKMAFRIDKYHPSPAEIAWKAMTLEPIESAHAGTFARAACIALIRVSRSTTKPAAC